MENMDSFWNHLCDSISEDDISSNGSLEDFILSPDSEVQSSYIDSENSPNTNNFSYAQSGSDNALCYTNHTGPSTSHSKRRKPICPLKKSRQRHAANQRERKRMSSINVAFDGLRTHIPVSQADKKLSKVDTLRLAIDYIHKLTEMVQASDAIEQRRNDRENKIIIRYPTSAFPLSMQEEPSYCCNEELVGHSLSWSTGHQQNDKRLSAKIWVPQDDTQEQYVRYTDYMYENCPEQW